MCRCHSRGSCHACGHAASRRRFLKGLGAVAAGGPMASLARASDDSSDAGKVRVAAVFLAHTTIREIWPYPGFDTQSRQQEVVGLLNKGCPGVEFVPVTVEQPADAEKALALAEDLDGVLVYVMTLHWSFRRAILDLAKVGKPTLVVDEFLGGSGVFLTGYSALCSANVPAAAVSTTRLEDVVAVGREFATVRRPGTTPASFARRCEETYRKTFAAQGEMKRLDDPVALTPIAECVRRFRESRFLIVGRGRAGQERDFRGAKGRYVDFDELQAFYAKVDRDRAAQWAALWVKQGDELPAGDYAEPSRPEPGAVDKAGAVYLATLELLKKYGTDNVTMNCLGGFAAGKLPAYPCLGFMQLLDDGGQGVCEAMPDDTLSMMMARILTGRPGFVSDPALDTSKNQIVYAHCVGTTKPFGPAGEANGYRIRTLHNRDPRGACSESFLPGGYMTTSFRTNAARKQLIIHHAKAVGAIETERGCRTKLAAEVCGDIGKLFDQWNQFGWHRVTVYGDVREPLAEFGKALGLKVIEEA